MLIFLSVSVKQRYNVNDNNESTSGKRVKKTKHAANNSNKFHIFLVFIFNVLITIIFGSINVDVYNVTEKKKWYWRKLAE